MRCFMNILVVDDEAHIRQLLKYNLQLDGHVVTLAENGRVALDKVKENPDLILLDIMMPEQDGLETCRILKADVKTRDIPVFFLTARSQATDIENAFRVGGNDYLTKPFDPNTLNKNILQKYEKYRTSISE